MEPSRQSAAAAYKVRHCHSNDCKFATSPNDHAMLVAGSQQAT